MTVTSAEFGLPDGSSIDSSALANGLRVFVLEDRSLPLVAINLWYHVGSKNEQPGMTGFAHLFEHMLFQGSANVDTNGHFAHVQRVGGVANGSTWYDRTNYYETLPAQHLDLGLWLESDRMGFLLDALTEEKLATQKSVVINERRQRVDNAPYGVAGERLYELLYPEGHPYRWPVIGYTEDIEAATLDQVHDFFRTYYAPNNAVLTLVGDVDCKAALESVERYFGEIPRGPEVAPLPRPSEANQGLSAELEDQVSLAKVTWACAVEPLGERDWMRASLLSEVLSGGKAGRLFRRLVQERTDAQSVGTYVMPTELCGTFVLQATAQEGQESDHLVEAVSEVCEEVLQGITADEHERALNALLTSQYEELQSLDDRADAISMFATYFDDPERAFREAELYRTITLDELNETAHSLLQLERAAKVTVIPAGARD